MHTDKQLNMLGLLACVLLVACTPGAKSYSKDSPSGRATIDNDSYYIQPGSYIPTSPSYGGCTQINDAPSCGGG